LKRRIHVVRLGRNAEECCGGDALDAMKDCCGGGFARKYKSKGEKVEELKDYLKELDAEAEAVREAIADLEAAKA
jgi:hypothetical protein